MSNSSEEELDDPFDDEDNDKVKFEWGQFIKFRKTFENTTGHRHSQIMKSKSLCFTEEAI